MSSEFEIDSKYIHLRIADITGDDDSYNELAEELDDLDYEPNGHLERMSKLSLSCHSYKFNQHLRSHKPSYVWYGYYKPSESSAD